MSTGQLKAAVYLMVAKMVEQQLAGMEKSVHASPVFVASLVELVYNQLVNVGQDLELFANHAGRTVIDPSDLLMVLRKNPVLAEYMRELRSRTNNERSEL